MQTLFALEFRGGEAEKILSYNLKEFAPQITDSAFARQLLKGVLAKRKEIHKIIRKHAPKWPITKIAPIDRAILEIGVYEIMFDQSVPVIVVINEAVETAKEFGDKNSQKFINGVLSSIMDEGLGNRA